MYKQHHYDHQEKKKKIKSKCEIKKYNDELNILQEGQQCTVDSVSLR